MTSKPRFKNVSNSTQGDVEVQHSPKGQTKIRCASWIRVSIRYMYKNSSYLQLPLGYTVKYCKAHYRLSSTSTNQAATAHTLETITFLWQLLPTIFRILYVFRVLGALLFPGFFSRTSRNSSIIFHAFPSSLRHPLSIAIIHPGTAPCPARSKALTADDATNLTGNFRYCKQKLRPLSYGRVTSTNSCPKDEAVDSSGAIKRCQSSFPPSPDWLQQGLPRSPSSNCQFSICKPSSHPVR